MHGKHMGQPDPHRRTGRTTRMMHELIDYLVRHPERRALLVCHSIRYAGQVLDKHAARKFHDRVTCTSPNTLHELHERALRGNEPRAAFVDHHAYEGWTVNKDNCAAQERLERDDIEARKACGVRVTRVR